jgi:hypothetical protein
LEWARWGLGCTIIRPFSFFAAPVRAEDHVVRSTSFLSVLSPGLHAGSASRYQQQKAR